MLHFSTKVLLLALLFFVAACIGLRLLRLLKLNLGSHLESAVIAVAFGFVIITEALLILGMIGLFTPLSIGLLILGLLVVSAGEAKLLIETFVKSLRSLSHPSVHYSVLILALGVFIFINILKALLPPHGPTDVLYYHLTLPKLYLTHGAVEIYPTFVPSFFPSNGELLFSLPLLLGGPVLVNLTHFGFALLTLMALYAYAQKHFEKSFALLPGIIYLTSPVVNSWGTMAYTSAIVGFYLFMLFMFLIEYRDQTQWQMAIVCGAMTGMALGTKYQAIPLAGGIYLFFVFLRIKSWRRFFPFLVFSLAIGLLLACPWFIRNALVTGNPFFPILQDLFSTKMFQPDMTWVTDAQAGELLRIAARKFVENPLSPFAYLLHGAWRNDDFQRFIGPLFIGFAPFAFLLRRNTIKWPLILFVCLLSCLFTLFLRGNIRYAILLICLLSLLCGAVGQEALRLAGKREGIILTLFLTFVVVLYSAQNYQLMLSHKRVLTSLNPRLTSPFLKKFERSYLAAEFANHQLPPQSKVLFHGLLRYFYFNFEPINDHLNQTCIVYEEAQNGEDIFRILHDHGFTHVISQDVISERHRSNTILYDEDPRFSEFKKSYLDKIFSANGISIYRIKDSSDGTRRGNSFAFPLPTVASIPSRLPASPSRGGHDPRPATKRATPLGTPD